MQAILSFFFVLKNKAPNRQADEPQNGENARQVSENLAPNSVCAGDGSAQ